MWREGTWLGMVVKEAAAVVTKALWASLLRDVMTTRPLHGSERTRSWLRGAGGWVPLIRNML